MFVLTFILAYVLVIYSGSTLVVLLYNVNAPLLCELINHELPVDAVLFVNVIPALLPLLITFSPTPAFAVYVVALTLPPNWAPTPVPSIVTSPVAKFHVNGLNELEPAFAAAPSVVWASLDKSHADPPSFLNPALYHVVPEPLIVSNCPYLPLVNVINPE